MADLEARLRLLHDLWLVDDEGLALGEDGLEVMVLEE